MHHHILLVLSIIQLAECTLSESFMKFIKQKFGPQTAQRLNRADLGPGGSFGGGTHIAQQKTMHEPVIIVHGITNKAGGFSDIRKFFLSKGYNDAEIYATTWGDGDPSKLLAVRMECDYVRRNQTPNDILIRELIIAVNTYTDSMVDILAFSMGSPVARKAILGGNCVDGGGNLGKPLKQLVDAFINVAGANHGSFLCILPVFGVCNMVNGLHCQSAFLIDINSKRHYEGCFVFSIYSTNDDKVGYQTCGKITSSIPGEDKRIQRSGMNHDQIMRNTVNIQFSLATKHSE